LFQATRNPDFNRHLMWDRPDDENAVLARVDSILDSARRGRLAALSAVIKCTGEWVSLYRFQPHAKISSSVEMGIWTHEKFWQGRFGHELTAACVDAAFALSNVSTLIAAAAPMNLGSCKILERCGLTRSSVVHRRTESGTEVALQEFIITREEWDASRTSHSFRHVPRASPSIGMRSSAIGQLRPSKHVAPLKGLPNVIGITINDEATGSAFPQLGVA
jgi:RimJ/RimL family protein N-acetyltransferase